MVLCECMSSATKWSKGWARTGLFNRSSDQIVWPNRKTDSFVFICSRQIESNVNHLTQLKRK